jgi:hypothetical protein
MYAWDIKSSSGAGSASAAIAGDTGHTGVEIDFNANVAYSTNLVRGTGYVLSIKALATATRAEGPPSTLPFTRPVLPPPAIVIPPSTAVTNRAVATNNTSGQCTITWMPLSLAQCDAIELRVLNASTNVVIATTSINNANVNLVPGKLDAVATGSLGETFKFTLQPFLGGVAGPISPSPTSYLNFPSVPSNVSPTTAMAGVDVTSTAVTFRWTPVPSAISYLLRVNPGPSQTDVPFSATSNPSSFVYTLPSVYTAVTPVPFHLFAANATGFGPPHTGGFTPVLASSSRYASILASQAITESNTSNKINYVVEPLAGRNMYAATGVQGTSNATTMASSIRKPFLVQTTVSTLTPKPYVIRTNRATNLCLSDAPNNRVVPIGQSYTKMLLFMVRSDADWTNPQTHSIHTFFSDYSSGGGHLIQQNSPNTLAPAQTGYFYISSNGGLNSQNVYNYRVASNAWNCMFVTCTFPGNTVQMYINSNVARATIVGTNDFGSRNYVNESDTGLGDLVTPIGYGCTADFLEVATWNAVLTPSQIQNEMTRLSTLYGIVISPSSQPSYLPLQGIVETGTNRDVTALADGNPSTFYDSLAPSGQWVGYNFGTPKAMTQLKFMPRATFAGRMVGGVFQASDGPSFTNAVNVLHTVTVPPPEGVYTVVTLSNQTAQYQYVRYVPPTNAYCNISEMDFVFV